MKLNHSILFLATVAVVLGSCSSGKNEDVQEQKDEQSTMDLLIGTYTGSGSEGIYGADFNPETGELSNNKLLARINNPSYLTTSKDKKFVYSVSEINNNGEVAAYRWNKELDSLELVNQLPSEGSGPCYIDMGAGDETVAVANYGSGTLAVYRVNSSGKLEPSPQVREHSGSGAVESRQKGPHAHCSLFKDNFLYVVDLGIDKIMSYRMEANGELGEGQVAFELAPGDGPRHLVFHPSSPLAFVANELSNTVVALKVDLQNGTMEQIGRFGTLPDGFGEQSYVADIRIAASGKFLYVSNRGHNSIAIFSVADDGNLENRGHEPVRGEWPRNFTFSPDGNFLLVANQNSGNIVVFKADKETGLLSYTGHEMKLSKPVCLKF